MIKLDSIAEAYISSIVEEKDRDSFTGSKADKVVDKLEADGYERQPHNPKHSEYEYEYKHKDPKKPSWMIHYRFGSKGHTALWKQHR